MWEKVLSKNFSRESTFKRKNNRDSAPLPLSEWFIESSSLPLYMKFDWTSSEDEKCLWPSASGLVAYSIIFKTFNLSE